MPAVQVLSPKCQANTTRGRCRTDREPGAPGAGVDQLAFAARLTAADPEAPGDLAAFLARARSGQG
ncbi:hypothetical protein ABZT34_35030 [Streptomyces sp. NPDC005329]|uniref:hypothetical protein n=1 Tax=Streptomyces sp. NPDC005329 TaxID=3157034 RepID=UPI0033BAEB99